MTIDSGVTDWPRPDGILGFWTPRSQTPSSLTHPHESPEAHVAVVCQRPAQRPSPKTGPGAGHTRGRSPPLVLATEIGTKLCHPGTLATHT